jgi:hypothetical protein
VQRRERRAFGGHGDFIMRHRSLAFFASTLALGFASLAGCSSDAPSDARLGHTAGSVVGGAPEEGYEAVGYIALVAQDGQVVGPICGATLVAPTVAVTAAHCIPEFGGAYAFAVGFGAVGSSPVVRARSIVTHKDYAVDKPLDIRHEHDVALIFLSEAVQGREPARIAGAEVGCDHRYIGYGRSTPGEYSVPDIEVGERKSASQCVRRLGGVGIYTRGGDGGLCWGDSGGPLMREGTNEILGVLADFDGRFECQVGNDMIFASLAAEVDFLQCAANLGPTLAAATGSTTIDRTTCGSEQTPVPVPACNIRCADYNYPEGVCYQGWACTNGCLEPKECDDTCPFKCAAFGFAEGQCHENWTCTDGCLEAKACEDPDAQVDGGVTDGGAGEDPDGGDLDGGAGEDPDGGDLDGGDDAGAFDGGAAQITDSGAADGGAGPSDGGTTSNKKRKKSRRKWR